jgi:hypothetical protein
VKRTPPSSTPDAYVGALSGWQRATVETLRDAVRTNVQLSELIKWGHLVYLANGPVLLIRAEENRVLFGFWRGKRLLGRHAGLRPSGKYEMATIELRQGDEVDVKTARSLIDSAVALNRSLGDPTKL